MSLKVAINGFGRIGRLTARFLVEDKNIELCAINDLTNPSTLAHLFKYDSVHGIFNGTVEAGTDYITINGKKIDIISERDITKLPWSKYGIDIVLECAGVFKDRDTVYNHIKNGAKKAIYSAPLKGADVTIVLGVNHESYNPGEHHVLSNASCTTNCLAPIAKVINDSFKIEKGFMTTIHSYTNDQKVLDLPHSDLRRARAAALSMIPTTTGAAKAVGLVLPELKGKLDGFAVRVPTPNVSAVDLCVKVEKNCTAEDINNAVKKASETYLKGIVEYCEKPLVSIDFNGSLYSSIFDSLLTGVIGDNLVKVLVWYDNEAGYSKRLAEITSFVGARL